MSKVSEKVWEEFLKLLPPAIFFFVALQLVMLLRSLMLRGTGIPLSTTLSVTLGALVLAKAVLLADMLPFINRYPDKPLLYNISWKTAIYFLVATALHYLEQLFEFWKAAGGFIAGNQQMLAERIWPHFWALQILIGILILRYCTAAEIVRVVGAETARRQFLGPLTRS